MAIDANQETVDSAVDPVDSGDPAAPPLVPYPIDPVPVHERDPVLSIEDPTPAA